MLCLKCKLLRWLLQSLPYDYVEDSFHRVVLQDRESSKAAKLRGLILGNKHI